MSQDEQRPVARTAEDELEWAVGNVDASDFVAVRVVDEHLPFGDVDAPVAARDDAFAAAASEGAQFGYGAGRPTVPL